MRGHKTGGRTKGVPNKVSASARDNIIVAFDSIGGIPALVRMGEGQPNRLLPNLRPIVTRRVACRRPDGAAVEIDLVGAKEILMQKLLPELFATDRDIKCKEIAR